MRRPAWLLLMALLVASASCRRVTPLPLSALTDITSLDDFRQAFNADRGRARLLVLLAPT